MKKRYRLLHENSFFFTITVTKDGLKTERPVDFKGGSRIEGRAKKGTFSTSDKDVINFLDGMEANKANGGVLFEEIDAKGNAVKSEKEVPASTKDAQTPKPTDNPVPTEKVETPKSTLEVLKEAAPETPEPTEKVEEKSQEAETVDTSSKKTSFPEITGTQQAINKIKELHRDIPHQEVRSRELMLAKAEELGYEFPNLD